MYVVKGWDKFQHYRDRNPPWVKLHKQFLDDFDFHSLPVASRALAPMLWLLASEHENPKAGAIEGPDSKISFRLHMQLSEFIDAIKPLIDKGFIVTGQVASDMLAERLRDATPETETESRDRARRPARKKGKSRGILDEICRDEILPSKWYDVAAERGVRDDQIYQSWKKFKETTSFPYRLKNWTAWIARERIPQRST